VAYLVSFTLPRFCDQSLVGSRKAQYYDRAPAWMAKLDTIVHELYHIDPQAVGIRRVERNDGQFASGSHGRNFLEHVAEMVGEYLASGPDPATFEFLRYSFGELESRYGGVLGTTFRTFPSFPQRYLELLPASAQPAMPRAVRIQPIKTLQGQSHFTEHDLVSRQFLERATRRLRRRETRRTSPTRQILLPQELPVAAARHE